MAAMETRLSLPSSCHAGLSERVMRQRALAVLGEQLVLWWHRARGRRALARMTDRQLRDIGLTRAQARHESAKPFWQP